MGGKSTAKRWSKWAKFVVTRIPGALVILFVALSFTTGLPWVTLSHRVEVRVARVSLAVVGALVTLWPSTIEKAIALSAAETAMLGKQRKIADRERQVAWLEGLANITKNQITSGHLDSSFDCRIDKILWVGLRDKEFPYLHFLVTVQSRFPADARFVTEGGRDYRVKTLVFQDTEKIAEEAFLTDPPIQTNVPEESQAPKKLVIDALGAPFFWFKVKVSTARRDEILAAAKAKKEIALEFKPSWQLSVNDQLVDYDAQLRWRLIPDIQ